jgi:hypothetical protein
VRRWLRVVAAASVAVAGCGGDGKAPPVTEAPLTTDGLSTASSLVTPPELVATSTTLAPSTVVPPVTAPAADLAATTAIVPLEGFAELPSGAGIGPLDLAGASDGDARERDALSRFGFQAGHARGFLKGSEEIVVTVLRFSSPANASAYLQDTIDSSLVSNGSFLFGIPVTGATGYREQGAGKDGEPYVTYGALFVRGDRCFEQLVRSLAAGPERSEADAQTLARRQAERVGG